MQRQTKLFWDNNVLLIFIPHLYGWITCTIHTRWEKQPRFSHLLSCHQERYKMATFDLSVRDYTQRKKPSLIFIKCYKMISKHYNMQLICNYICNLSENWSNTSYLHCQSDFGISSLLSTASDLRGNLARTCWWKIFGNFKRVFLDFFLRSCKIDAKRCDEHMVRYQGVPMHLKFSPFGAVLMCEK